MQRAIRPRLPLMAVILAVGFNLPQISHAFSGRLIIHIEGSIVGAAPPTLVVQGTDRQESVLLGPLAVSTGEIRFDDIAPGTYRVFLEGAASPDYDLPAAAEVGIAAGRTSVLRLDLETARLFADPFRPDPFGTDETWDGAWLEMLPGAGDQAALAALTSPAPPRQWTVEGLDVSGSGFRHRIRLGGESISRTAVLPIGPVSAAFEEATGQIFARTQGAYADAEAATGSGGQTSMEATFSRTFPSTAGRPRLFASFRGLKYLDAAPSIFEDGNLPHSGLEGLELLTRADVRLDERTRLTGLLYGEGTIRKYFLESFRFDPRHGPREERANLHAAMRATHDPRRDLRLIGEVAVQRTFLESGDGTYFDNLRGYGKELPPMEDEFDLYWEPGHAYDYFHRKVHLDWTGRLEAWKNPGTNRSVGGGIWFRKGTYRSYEHLQPTLAWLNEVGGTGGYGPAQSIGYNRTGEARAEEEGMKPGEPNTLSAFLTARRPMAGGEIEAGLRTTHYRPGQRSLRSLSDPLGDDENLQPADLRDKRTTTTVDPRVGYTLMISDRTRLWLAGGAETWLPPSEAVYFSTAFLERAAYRVEDGDVYPRDPIFGNPNLEPERVWTAIAAVGTRFSPTLSLRLGIEGRQTNNAITPRSFSIGAGSLAYYVNDGTRDLIDLSIRADWDPSPRVRMRASYDLSKARTETVEPTLLDAAWLDENLPIRTVDLREGLPPVLPPYDDGVDRGFYPSLYDRRHRISVAATVQPPANLFGDAARFILSDLDVGLLFRLASGRPFTQAVIYPSGSLKKELDVLDKTDGFERNAERSGWTGQVDLRLGRTIRAFGAEGQLWVEITNLTDERNEIRVYPATGEADDDGYLTTDHGRSPEYTGAYAMRIRDQYNFSDPLLLHAGIRVRLP